MIYTRWGRRYGYAAHLHIASKRLSNEMPHALSDSRYRRRPRIARCLARHFTGILASMQKEVRIVDDAQEPLSSIIGRTIHLIYGVLFLIC